MGESSLIDFSITLVVVLLMGPTTTGATVLTGIDRLPRSIQFYRQELQWLGEVGCHYGDINDTAKWVLSLAMILGRLEIFTLLVLLSPAFWRR